MAYNNKIGLSICQYFMGQQFSIALIIEFVETVNREVSENTYFRSNVSNAVIYKHFTSTTAR